MPMIVLSYPAERLDPGRAREAVAAVRDSLARNYAVRGMGDVVTAMARCRLQPVGEGMRVDTVASEGGLYEMEVHIPQAGLTPEGAEAFMREAAAILIAAEGSETTPGNLERVCGIVHEMPDGWWSIGGAVMNRRRIAKEAVTRRRAARAIAPEATGSDAVVIVEEPIAAE